MRDATASTTGAHGTPYRRDMPVHRIELELPKTDVQNTDVQFSIWSDEELLGELRISRGTIDWRPGHHQQALALEWERFDELMREHGNS